MKLDSNAVKIRHPCGVTRSAKASTAWRKIHHSLKAGPGRGRELPSMQARVLLPTRRRWGCQRLDLFHVLLLDGSKQVLATFRVCDGCREDALRDDLELIPHDLFPC